MKSAGHSCLTTADAMGAQATERFGKKEKAVRLRFKCVFRHVNGLMRRTKAKVQKKENKEQMKFF